ncbi:hypothetical protein [Streptomonospora litoralis]|uniref:Uncharacterized protein n=1 Tax=Streptomonospora litoralis TaxID=2498135 RepID=A0A4P6Q069_9ACTN|nr:hypothetical protein [Streptomonospora litoralis]QBI52571.1 hypothetical protein EKD16_03805 [Streptomonospora litoralis]
MPAPQPPTPAPTPPPSAEARQPSGAAARIAGPVVTGLGYAVLLVVGISVGLGGSVLAGWLSYLWQAGMAGQAVAAVALLGVVAVLFAGCRAAGWGMGSRLGAGLPALGWGAAVFSLIAMTSGGDIVLTSTVIDYCYLFGGLAAVGIAVVLTEPGP